MALRFCEELLSILLGSLCHLSYIPVLVVRNLNTLNSEGVLIIEVVALVDLIVVFTLGSSDCVLTHCL